jgi:hypothetical protein
MKRYLDTHVKPYIKHQDFVLSVIFSLILLGLSLVLNFYAGNYATKEVSNSVTDLVLSNIPVFDVDAIFVYGAIALWAFVIAIFFYRPRVIPFTLKSISLFIVIRAIFVTLTHIGTFPDQIVINPNNAIRYFTFGGDLFFSGHTGLPFLLSLIFWNNKKLRYTFLATSLMFGTIVLLGHLHYSIDVLSAFFITYTIYILAEKFFKQDKKIFEGEVKTTNQPV